MIHGTINHLDLTASDQEHSPAEYPDYAPGYYAVFFADPDGVKLEYVYMPAAPEIIIG